MTSTVSRVHPAAAAAAAHVPGDVIKVSNDRCPALVLKMLVMYKTFTDFVLITTDITELLHTNRHTHRHTYRQTHTRHTHRQTCLQTQLYTNQLIYTNRFDREKISSCSATTESIKVIQGHRALIADTAAVTSHRAASMSVLLVNKRKQSSVLITQHD